MQKPKDSKLKSSIVKGLRNDPDGVFIELSGLVEHDSDKDVLKSQLDKIASLLAEEASQQESRKGLSRQIGQAKKNNEDTSAIIAQVSQLSTQIDELNVLIKDRVSDIQTTISSLSSAVESSPILPQHLISDSQHPEKDATRTLPAGYTISHVERTDSAEWQSFVEQTPHATVYHDACWKDIIKTNFNHDLHSIVCRNESGEIVGVLPLCHLKSHIFGSFTVSMPYFNYGGPLSSDPAVDEAMLLHASNLSDELGCSHMEIRETRARDNWRSVQRKVSMILPLPTSDEILQSQLGTKLRAQVNKAESNGLSVKFGGMELLAHFYQVFSHNMRDLGTPVYGKRIFADIIKSFPESAFIAVVYKDEKPLAVGFLLGYRDKIEIPWASSIRSQNHLGANMFMYRAILAEAIARQYHFFDFGRSTKDASTYKFKKQWGAKEHPLHWHYWTRDNNDLPEINPDNPKYKLVIKAWQSLPVFITQLIGPKIARNLP